MKTFADLVIEGSLEPKDFYDWLDTLEDNDDIYELIGFPKEVYNKTMAVGIRNNSDGREVLEEYFSNLQELDKSARAKLKIKLAQDSLSTAKKMLGKDEE